ncbi:hypothetical protein AB0M22_04020 [Nocardia sp. NPDC051756]|uniref:hypothetical protein n=1 Tax=Nocardia sp. NPDC051756 TaxID=3154751 RepID=UPI0034213133
MDPVSLGIAAAALLASKFGEELARDAGGSAWRAVGRLRELVTSRFRDEPETHTALTTSVETAQARSVVADRISAVARHDPGFAGEVERLVTAARQDRTAEVFVAQAFDDAKQVNIHGDNSGTINLG